MATREGVSWDKLVFGRMLDELVLVGILHQVGKDDKPIPRDQILAHLEASIEAERKMIHEHGRKLAAQLYGYFEGRRSSMRAVDFVMTFDYAGHYRSLGTTEAEAHATTDTKAGQTQAP